MSAAQLVEALMGAGVRMWVEAGALEIDAPAGFLTSADLTALRAHKAEVLALLSAPDAMGPTPKLDLADAARRVAPFLERTRAELAGAYCRPLPWPKGGCLVPDPARHWRTHGARFPADLAAVLWPLSEAWLAGDRPLAKGWPVSPDLYRWEYSRLVAWFRTAPNDAPTQLKVWAGSITAFRNPLFDLRA